MSTIADIKTLLTGVESSIYLSSRPNTPAITCVLYDTGGRTPSHVFDAIAYYQPTIQVYIRDTDYEDGYARCEAISVLLNGTTEQTINSKRYISVFQMGDIFFLGYDEKNQAELTVNFVCKVEK